LAPWRPPELELEPAVVASTAEHPARTVKVAFDDLGVPPIFGQSETALVYGLGFVHARDRGFQLQAIRAAAHGRLTELFGEGLLAVDQRLRIASFGVAESLAAMSARDRAIFDAYSAGVNAGYAHSGSPSELALLGKDVPEFTPLDALAIARLQAWQLARGLRDEIARVIALASAGPQVAATMTAPTDSGAVPIVTASAHDGAPMSHATDEALTAPIPLLSGSEPIAEAAIAAMPTLGASNSWAVSGRHTATGAPILCNDPHLAHRAPSVFYLAHLETPELTVVGATFPGVPAVLIGHTRHFAWGMTASYADVQDLVRIELDPNAANHYIVDGRSRAFGIQTQRYDLGDGATHQEQWRTTIYGPVLPPGFTEVAQLDATHALMWGAFATDGTNRHAVSGFWDLARAGTIDVATRALGRTSIAAQNVVLAGTDGTIAYRLSALTPLRAGQGGLPQDGKYSVVRWPGFADIDHRPRMTDPPAGFIVTANQRIVETDGPAAAAVGVTGATPERARRINERLRELVSRGGVTADEALAIQQDVTSPAARQLAKTVGELCPRAVRGFDAATVAAFCDAAKGFDGRYTIDSAGALPFTLLHEAMRQEVIARQVGPERAAYLERAHLIDTTYERLLLSSPADALFDDPKTPDKETLSDVAKKAAPRALERIVELAGSEPAGWTWGDVHQLEIAGPVARAPLIGGLWTIDRGAQSGYRTTPRAESRFDITHGAAFRMVAEMTKPPTVRMIIDTGQSGHPGTPHWDDQSARWAAGQPVQIPTSPEAIAARTKGRLLLVPRR